MGLSNLVQYTSTIISLCGSNLLTPAVLNAIENSVLSWLATVDNHGCPNVSPKEVFLAYGNNEILVANIASPQSVKNIKQNPNVCISFVDIFKQKGFKVKGQASVLTKGMAGFVEKHKALYQITGEQFPIQSVIAITVNQCKPVLAPTYFLQPNTTEASQEASTLKTYGVTRVK